MRVDDLPAILKIAEQVHPDYPEDPVIFMERQQLYPQGCWVLQQIGYIGGYLLSHPWQLGQPPALNGMLNQLPSKPNTYYLHDIALLPSARGSNAASLMLSTLCQQAHSESLDNLSLIAVNQSSGFWQHQHFMSANNLLASPEKLHSYGDHACYMVRKLTPTSHIYS